MQSFTPKQLAQSSFIRFALVGLLSTILDFAVLNLLVHFKVAALIAGALGFFAGFTNGYLLNSRYVFQKASTDRYIKYLLVSLGGLGITEILLDILHLHLSLGLNRAKIIAVIIVFFWNYVLSKLWVFA